MSTALNTQGINRLPDEIFGLICERLRGDKKPSRRATKTILNTALVCKAWHQSAIFIEERQLEIQHIRFQKLCTVFASRRMRAELSLGAALLGPGIRRPQNNNLNGIADFGMQALAIEGEVSQFFEQAIEQGTAIDQLVRNPQLTTRFIKAWHKLMREENEHRRIYWTN